MLGAGSRIQALGRRAAFICLTDGSPKNLRDAHAAGCCSREEYARMRRREFETVMAMARVEAKQCRWLGIIDQEASYHLAQIAQILAAALAEINPDLVLTHSYEGGHPDHDATAFSVFAARSILKKSGKDIPAVEFTSYNAGPQGTGWATDFLADPDSPVTTINLSKEEWSAKRQMMGCYVSQKWILDVFSEPVERFRPAPSYDFARAPHEGRLHYERFEWGITGAQWRALAGKAAGELGIE